MLQNKMKLTAIVGTGSVYHPWFPHCLASVYNAVDEIVVINGGADLSSKEEPREFNIPLKQVTRDIENLNVDGKIVEIKDFTLHDVSVKLPLVLGGEEKYKLQAKGIECYDLMGFGMTLAHETALKRGANLILALDSDHVCYPEVINVRNENPIVFRGYEFVVDEFHLAWPEREHERYEVGCFTYIPRWGDYYTLFRCPNIVKRGSIHCDRYRNGHYRGAAPSWFSTEERFSYFYERSIYHFWQNYDYERVPWGAEMREKAREVASRFMKGNISDWFTPPKTPKITDVKPPPALSMKPIDYIMEVGRVVRFLDVP